MCHLIGLLWKLFNLMCHLIGLLWKLFNLMWHLIGLLWKLFNQSKPIRWHIRLKSFQSKPIRWHIRLKSFQSKPIRWHIRLKSFQSKPIRWVSIARPTALSSVSSCRGEGIRSLYEEELLRSNVECLTVNHSECINCRFHCRKYPLTGSAIASTVNYI
jgi:hypothetical protein